jgi:hypothetical protein
VVHFEGRAFECVLPYRDVHQPMNSRADFSPSRSSC